LCRRDGEPYLIVDCGGGTVDLVVHAKKYVEVEEDGRKGMEFSIHEVAPGSGGLCGDTYVDEEFVAYMASKCPPKVFEKFRTEKVDQYCKLMLNWERCKQQFTGTEETLALDIPTTLWRHLLAADDDRDDFSIPKADMKQMFQPAVDKISSLVA
jgi:hypothetical protein